MSTEVIIRRETELDRPNLEHDPIFSEFTHPALEEFIQRFINQYKVQ